MTKQPPKQPPVVRVMENPFGEVTEAQVQGAPLADKFFLAGYSDQRHERDLEIKAEGKLGKPRILPRRFQFVSVENRDKTPIGDKELEFRRLGYRPVSYAEAESLGLDLKNSSAVKGPDGNVRVGSQMLMVTDAATAARNYQQQREDTEIQFDLHVRGQLESAGDKYNAKFGKAPKDGPNFTIDTEIIE